MTTKPATDSDNLTVLSVEASDALVFIVKGWLDENDGDLLNGPPYSEAQHEVFKALGIEVEDGQR